MMKDLSKVIVTVTLAVYAIQLALLQLFIRLEPTMFGAGSMPFALQLLIDDVVRYIPELVFASTVLLILLAMHSSSQSVKVTSYMFLVMIIIDESVTYLALGGGWLYGSLYWLMFSVLVLIFPEVLLAITTIEKRSVAVGAMALSSAIATSFYAWSFLSRITFSIPPIGLIPDSVYAFAISFAILSVTIVKKINAGFYVSLFAASVLMAIVTYYTSQNVLTQKIVNMILQTSLGAPTPLPWSAPLFFLIIFSDVYSLYISVSKRSIEAVSVAAGFTMVFTSVYLPYNMLYTFIMFSGALLIYLGK